MNRGFLPIEEPNIPSQKRDGEFIYEVESVLRSGVVDRPIIEKIINYLEARGTEESKKEQIKLILLKSLGRGGYLGEEDGNIILDFIREIEKRKL